MSARAARDLTASDTANEHFSWVMVTGTQGSLVVGHENGSTVTLSDVPVGVWVPVGDATHITTASTATGLMVV